MRNDEDSLSPGGSADAGFSSTHFCDNEAVELLMLWTSTENCLRREPF